MIVASDNINSLPATPAEIQPSVSDIHASQINLESNANGFDKGIVSVNTGTTIIRLPEPDRSKIHVATLEIMRQYPGGINALLSFLKKNIHSPGNGKRGKM
ncbi:MAG: hypothetical protein ABI834_10820 [Ginsengibacter sp.]